jgi:hypothetical protein
MIHYQLRCAEDHPFDGWFKDSDAFDKQAKVGFVECPTCGSAKVSRALMAPAIPKKGRAARTKVAPAEAAPPAPPSAPAQPQPQAMAGPVPAQLVALLQRVRAEVEQKCEYVGSEFAEEARKIHLGETKARGIYGEASTEEAEALKDEGIDIAQIPWVPRADG